MGFMGNNPYNLITRRIRFTDFTLRREHIKREQKRGEKKVQYWISIKNSSIEVLWTKSGPVLHDVHI